MDPRNFVKVPILWMVGGNINFVGFTEEEELKSLLGFWTPRSGSEIPPNVNPSPLTHSLLYSLSLSLSLAEDLVGLRQEIPKRGRYNHSQRGDS